MAGAFLAASIYGRLLPPNDEAIAGLVAACLDLGVIFVAEDDAGQVIAMLAIAAIGHPFTRARFAEEQAWWVEPKARGRKIGVELLEAARAWTKAQGLPFLKVGAPADSLVGTLYESLGYRAIETAYVLEV